MAMAKTAARALHQRIGEAVEGSEQRPHGDDVDQIRGVPVPPEQQIEARRQRRYQRRLEAEHGIQFGQVSNDPALRESVVHRETVGEVPGIVPVGRGPIKLQPEQRGGRKYATQKTTDKAAAFRP